MENRESFRARLMSPEVARALTKEDVARIELSYMVSKYGHRAQVRKERGPNGDPLRYFEHPRRVVIILMDELKIIDPVMIKAGFLHDCVEDTDEISEAIVQIVGNRETLVMVQLLSKKPKEGYLERLQLHADWRTLVMKSCDRKDNLRSMGQSTPAFRKKQYEETRRDYLPLFDRMLDEAPIRYRDRLYTHCQEIRLLLVDEA